MTTRQDKNGNRFSHLPIPLSPLFFSSPVHPENPVLFLFSVRIRQDNRKPGLTGQERKWIIPIFPFPFPLFSSPVYPENPVILSSSSSLLESDRITGNQDQQDKKVIMKKIFFFFPFHYPLSSSLLLFILKILLSCPLPLLC